MQDDVRDKDPARHRVVHCHLFLCRYTSVTVGLEERVGIIIKTKRVHPRRRIRYDGTEINFTSSRHNNADDHRVRATSARKPKSEEHTPNTKRKWRIVCVCARASQRCELNSSTKCITNSRDVGRVTILHIHIFHCSLARVFQTQQKKEKKEYENYSPVCSPEELRPLYFGTWHT